MKTYLTFPSPDEWEEEERMKDIIKGTTVVHKDPQGPRGKGIVTSADQWSVRVKWESGRSGVYHPRILIKVKA